MTKLSGWHKILAVLGILPVIFMVYGVFFYTSTIINHFRTTDDYYGNYYFIPNDKTDGLPCVTLTLRKDSTFLQRYLINGKPVKETVGTYHKAGRNITFNHYIFKTNDYKNPPNYILGGIDSYVYRDHLGRYAITSDEDPDSDNNFKRVNSLLRVPFCNP